MQKVLSKSSPTVSTLVRELFNYYDYFLRLSEFLDLFDKVFPINFKFPNLIFQPILREQCKQSKFLKRLQRLLFFILNLTYLYKLLRYLTLQLLIFYFCFAPTRYNLFYQLFKSLRVSFIKVLKKLVLALFYCFSQEIRLGD